MKYTRLQRFWMSCAGMRVMQSLPPAGVPMLESDHETQSGVCRWPVGMWTKPRDVGRGMNPEAQVRSDPYYIHQEGYPSRKQNSLRNIMHEILKVAICFLYAAISMTPRGFRLWRLHYWRQGIRPGTSPPHLLVVAYHQKPSHVFAANVKPHLPWSVAP